MSKITIFTKMYSQKFVHPWPSHPWQRAHRISHSRLIAATMSSILLFSSVWLSTRCWSTTVWICVHSATWVLLMYQGWCWDVEEAPVPGGSVWLRRSGLCAGNSSCSTSTNTASIMLRSGLWEDQSMTDSFLLRYAGSLENCSGLHKILEVLTLCN